MPSRARSHRGSSSVGHHPLGPDPMKTRCPHCKASVITSTKTTPGLFTWLLCGLLILLGCWLGCCLIPFCVESCLDIEHTCPNCSHFIGKYERC